MSVVYDGPLPSSKSKKAPPPSRSSTMPASRSPAPLTSQASGQSVPNFAAYDGPLPPGRSPARAATPSERPTRLRTSQSARSSDYGETQTDPPASVSNGSGLPYDGPLPSKALNRNVSRSAGKRAPPSQARNWAAHHSRGRPRAPTPPTAADLHPLAQCVRQSQDRQDWRGRIQLYNSGDNTHICRRLTVNRILLTKACTTQHAFYPYCS